MERPGHPTLSSNRRGAMASLPSSGTFVHLRRLGEEGTAAHPLAGDRQRSQRATVWISLIALLAGSSLVLTSPSLPVTGPTDAAARSKVHSFSSVGSSKPGAVAVDPEQRTRSQLIGDWQRSFFGKHTLSVQDDGSATMEVEPNVFWCLLLGKRLKVQVLWEVRRDHIISRMVGGTPPKKIKIVKRMWGDYWDQQILELTEQRLVLLWDDGTKDVWFRAGPDTARSRD